MNVLFLSVDTESDLPVLPLGMSLVAAATEAAGHFVETRILTAGELIEPVLKPIIQAAEPAVIGVTLRNIDNQSMADTVFYPNTIQTLVSLCKNLSNAPIVLGGPGYAIFPESALAFTGADYGVTGDGEVVFPRLLSAAAAGRSPEGVAGVYPANARVSGTGSTAPAPINADLSRASSVFPTAHLALPASIREKEIWLPFQTRRGCPLGCTYCSTASIEGRRLRKRSLQQVVEWLSRYSNAGFDRFFFVDNTFNLPPSYAEALCDEIINAGLSIQWRAIVYPSHIRESLVAKMAAAGCTWVSLGFESAASPVLRGLNKRFSPQDVRHAAEVMRKHGIRRTGFLMFGGPGETRDTVERSIDFVESLDLEMVKVTCGIRLYPHTPLSARAVAEGRISPDTDLLAPCFYIVKGLETWLPSRMEQLMQAHPDWVR
jgi:radical SAM superfamily enzyme YgiQ (UPF0313 family)